MENILSGPCQCLGRPLFTPTGSQLILSVCSNPSSEQVLPECFLSYKLQVTLASIPFPLSRDTRGCSHPFTAHGTPRPLLNRESPMCTGKRLWLDSCHVHPSENTVIPWFTRPDTPDCPMSVYMQMYLIPLVLFRLFKKNSFIKMLK